MSPGGSAKPRRVRRARARHLPDARPRWPLRALEAVRVAAQRRTQRLGSQRKWRKRHKAESEHRLEPDTQPAAPKPLTLNPPVVGGRARSGSNGHNRSVELFTLTARPEQDPKAAVRVIADTNVAAPVLRWLALDEAQPTDEVVAAFRWMHRRATSSLVNHRDIRFEFKWAAIETSRAHGYVDGPRLARIHAADEQLHAWLFSNMPIGPRLAGNAPRLKPTRGVAERNNGVADGTSVTAVSLALIGLSQLHRRRQAGELRSVNERFAFLQDWSETVVPMVGLSADLILIAVQTAFSGDGAPARTMCKFEKYRDVDSARSTAANAAWDLHFLRAMRASESGLPPYDDYSGPTTLLTFDRKLAAAADDLIYRAPVHGPWKSSVAVTMSNRTQLQRDVLGDPHMLARLDRWCLDLANQQRARWTRPQRVEVQDVEDALHRLLAETFPTAG